jgi:hypothetical protein
MSFPISRQSAGRRAALLTKLGYDKGAQVISQVANYDEKPQNDQIENIFSGR